jgi:hypothetical protein
MIEVRALDDGCSLELSGEPHSTEDGSWQPPRESPMRFELYHPHHGVVREPENLAGALIDFDPEGSPQPAWLRSGGRIALRESDVG